ncbi:unnamed protein product [Rhodiola kirilowii]
MVYLYMSGDGEGNNKDRQDCGTCKESATFWSNGIFFMKKMDGYVDGLA